MTAAATYDAVDAVANYVSAAGTYDDGYAI